MSPLYKVVCKLKLPGSAHPHPHWGQTVHLRTLSQELQTAQSPSAAQQVSGLVFSVCCGVFLHLAYGTVDVNWVHAVKCVVSATVLIIQDSHWRSAIQVHPAGLWEGLHAALQFTGLEYVLFFFKFECMLHAYLYLCVIFWYTIKHSFFTIFPSPTGANIIRISPTNAPSAIKDI